VVFSTRSSSERKPRVSMDVAWKAIQRCVCRLATAADTLHADHVEEGRGTSAPAWRYRRQGGRSMLLTAHREVHGAQHPADGVCYELGAGGELVVPLARHLLHVAALVLEELRGQVAWRLSTRVSFVLTVPMFMLACGA
jgi:hypothetical protein